MTAMMVAASVGLMNAQTTQKQVVEEGGTGPFKSEVVGDASCPGFTVYRPQNLKAVVARQGVLPVIVYANGACFNNNVEMRLLLSEVASYGYVAAAIGPYDEADVMAQWRGVLKSAYPETKGEVVMANGEKILPLTAEERQAREEQQRMEREQAQKNAKKNKKKQQEAPPFRTYPKMLLEVLDWLTDQNAASGSEYYHCLDLDHVAAMGQSCGGAQVLGVAHDPPHQDLRDAELWHRRHGDDGVDEGVAEEPPPAHVLHDWWPRRHRLRQCTEGLRAHSRQHPRGDAQLQGRPQRHLLREAWRQLCQGSGEMA